MTLAQLQAAIQAKGYGTDTAAQQLAFLNETYRKVTSKERWPFLEAQDKSLSTAAGTSSYSLATLNYRNLDAVRIEITAQQQYVDLRYLSPQAFRSYEHIDRDQATPVYWTVYANQLHFWPVPDAVYLITIDYINEPPDLVSGADTPVIPLPYHDLLVWGAVKSLAYRERDWVGTQIADQEYETLLTRFQEEYLVRQRQTASHVKKSGYNSTQLPYPFSHSGF